MKKYKLLIVRNTIEYILVNMNNIIDMTDEEGSVFFYINNTYRNNECIYNIFDIMEEASKLNLDYINTIVIPEKNNFDNISYLIWFAKNREKYYFNKDVIREKHIWKDVEWGKREKNYNIKGKDPGNVWIPTKDDGNAHIIEHILLNRNQVYNRIISSSVVEIEEACIISNCEEDLNYMFNNNKIEIRYINNSQENQISFGIKQKIDSVNYSKGKVSAKVFFATSEDMNQVEKEHIKLIVTSPPYWDLKDYFKKDQIGKEDYEKYSRRMYKVWKECYDRLTNDGSLWININVRVRNGQPIYLPNLFIKQCKKIGYIFRTIIIWHKSSAIPTSSRNLSDHFEYVLVFTKSDRISIKDFSINMFNDYKNMEINKSLIWNINRKAGSIAKKTIHPAIYPIELVNRIVELGTNQNDIVMDPFLGSGTSLISSLNLNRNFVGYEYYEGFKELMQYRFNKELVNNKEVIFE